MKKCLAISLYPSSAINDSIIFENRLKKVLSNFDVKVVRKIQNIRDTPDLIVYSGSPLSVVNDTRRKSYQYVLNRFRHFRNKYPTIPSLLICFAMHLYAVGEGIPVSSDSIVHKQVMKNGVIWNHYDYILSECEFRGLETLGYSRMPSGAIFHKGFIHRKETLMLTQYHPEDSQTSFGRILKTLMKGFPRNLLVQGTKEQGPAN